MKQEILSNLAQLLDSNDQAFLGDIFASYLDTLNTHMHTISTALESEDLKTIKQSAHAIKGCAATVQHSQIMDLAIQLEELAKNEELEKSHQVIIELKDYMEKIGFIL